MLAIDWPSWWNGEKSHFLEGIPFIGSQCKIIRHVRCCLKSRTESLCLKAWTDAGYSFSLSDCVARKVFDIVTPYISWPNHYFFPEDRVALLFGVIPGVGFDAEDIVEDIRESFNVKGVSGSDELYYEIVLQGKFKEFVNLVVKKM